MSKNAGLEIVGAGWGHRISEIEAHMREHCNYYFETVGEFISFISCNELNS